MKLGSLFDGSGGFPDWWDADVGGSDSARYKMWGNGIALPCAFDVLRRIVEHEDI